MVNRRVGFRSVVAMARCALLAFLGFLFLTASSGGVLASLGLVAALTCSAAWLTVLLADNRGSALAQWVKRAGARLGSLHAKIQSGRLEQAVAEREEYGFRCAI